MPKTTFDEDGYPTDETLENIKQWPHKDSFNGLVEYVQGAWNHGYGYMIQGDGKFTLVTGGWSGNESIVDALLENPLFWAKYWKASFRGGSFDFDLPK